MKAAPELVLEEPLELELEVPEPPLAVVGLLLVASHLKPPLMTSSFFSLRRSSQLKLPRVLCMLKLPSTSLSAPRESLFAVSIYPWRKLWELGSLLVEGTAEVNGTVDTLEGGQADGGELIITGNGESTVNSLQDGHADVGQLGVVLEEQVTGLGQVGSGEGLELGTPEAELTGELLERRQGDGGDVLEGHVGTGAQVGEVDLEGVVVTREADQIGGVHKVVDVDGPQVTVVLNAEGTDGLEGDTVQVSQASVGDADVASLGDTLGEGQRLELRESLPVNGTNGIELSEIEEGQGGETRQVEGLSDRGKGGSSDGADVGTTRADQTTVDLLDTTERELAAVGLVDGDITLDGGAGVDAISIALALDLSITAGCRMALLVGV